MNHEANQQSGMRLYDADRHRLYLNAIERQRFLQNLKRLPDIKASFCLTLLHTGCRISEALELTTDRVDTSHNVIIFRSLKKRQYQIMREVPVPEELVRSLVEVHNLGQHSGSENAYPLLWQHQGHPINRATAYRWVKAAMDGAGIFGPQACPKGLRHGYGVHAMRSGIQLNMLQKWMGHADMSTTAIYANATGPEAQEIAKRMWQ